MPDYSVRSAKLGQTPQQEPESTAGWTSLAGLVGAIVTMVFIWLIAQIIRKKSHPKSGPDIIAA
jgi:uncharacterized membrane protein YccC